MSDKACCPKCGTEFPEIEARIAALVEENAQLKLNVEFDKQKAGVKPPEYPDGRMGAEDKGALMIKVGTEQGKVCIEFADSTQWLAMPPAMAVAFGQSLMAKAFSLQRKGG